MDIVRARRLVNCRLLGSSRPWSRRSNLHKPMDESLVDSRLLMIDQHLGLSEVFSHLSSSGLLGLPPVLSAVIYRLPGPQPLSAHPASNARSAQLGPITHRTASSTLMRRQYKRAL